LEEHFVDEWMILMKRATADDIRRWTAEIEAEEQAIYRHTNTDEIDSWVQQQDLDAAYEKIRRQQDNANILRLLKLAGIQKTLDMTDDEFLERGELWLKDQARKKKRKRLDAKKQK
jgi:hypothetical protein